MYVSIICCAILSPGHCVPQTNTAWAARDIGILDPFEVTATLRGREAGMWTNATLSILHTNPHPLHHIRDVAVKRGFKVHTDNTRSVWVASARRTSCQSPSHGLTGLLSNVGPHCPQLCFIYRYDLNGLQSEIWAPHSCRDIIMINVQKLYKKVGSVSVRVYGLTDVWCVTSGCSSKV